MKILFLLKEVGTSGSPYSPVKSSGLLNSAKMICESIHQKFDIDTKMELCVDGNSIDHEIYIYNPDIVIIEAIWVTPMKIKELVSLYPKVRFVIRIHSEIPFLSNEGLSIAWIKEYIKLPNTRVAFNSKESFNNFKNTINSNNFLYLPNIYEDVQYDNKEIIKGVFKKYHHQKEVINIGCFSSIRPFKNILMQGFAAISFADKHHLSLNFHINGTRIEQNGNSTLTNLRSLFKNTRHKLVEHGWLEREDFLRLISEMDIGMQVSVNESFNIVSGDFVKMNIPIVVSNTIDWLPDIDKVKFDNMQDIVSTIEFILSKKHYVTNLNNKYLYNYNKKALKEWYNFIIYEMLFFYL
jgi:hypothetical protein